MRPRTSAGNASKVRVNFPVMMRAIPSVVVVNGGSAVGAQSNLDISVNGFNRVAPAAVSDVAALASYTADAEFA